MRQPTSLQQRLVKTGGRLVKHACYYWLLLAEGHLTRQRFGSMLRRIAALPAERVANQERQRIERSEVILPEGGTSVSGQYRSNYVELFLRETIPSTFERPRR